MHSAVWVRAFTEFTKATISEYNNNNNNNNNKLIVGDCLEWPLANVYIFSGYRLFSLINAFLGYRPCFYLFNL